MNYADFFDTKILNKQFYTCLIENQGGTSKACCADRKILIDQLNKTKTKENEINGIKNFQHKVVGLECSRGVYMWGVPLVYFGKLLRLITLGGLNLVHKLSDENKKSLSIFNHNWDKKTSPKSSPNSISILSIKTILQLAVLVAQDILGYYHRQKLNLLEQELYQIIQEQPFSFFKLSTDNQNKPYEETKAWYRQTLHIDEFPSLEYYKKCFDRRIELDEFYLKEIDKNIKEFQYYNKNHSNSVNQFIWAPIFLHNVLIDFLRFHNTKENSTLEQTVI